MNPSVSQFTLENNIEVLPHVDRSEGAQSQVRISFLGTAGFIFEFPAIERTIVVDPYLTRPNLLAHFGSRFHPNYDLVNQKIPKCDYVLIGHSHSDHLLDAPVLYHRAESEENRMQVRDSDRARLIIGTETTRQIMLAAGVPDSHILSTEGDREVDVRDDLIRLRAIGSRHAPISLFKWPPFSWASNATDGIPFYDKYGGEDWKSLPWPLRSRDFVEGGVLDWLVQASGKTILHIDSAKVVQESWRDIDVDEVDVLCLCAMGWNKGNLNSDGESTYVHDVLERFRPKHVIPCHWDWMFASYPEHPGEARVMGLANLKGFLQEIKNQAEKLNLGGDNNDDFLVFLDFDGVLEI